MPKTIKYSELDKKLKKSVHLPLKKIDTVYLDDDKPYYINETKYVKNLRNIIIKESLINNKHTDIRIKNTNAKNIYVENYDNLGGITIPFNIIKKGIEFYISFTEKSNINKINILNTKNITIDLENDLKSIDAKTGKEDIIIYVEYAKEEIRYKVDNLGNVIKTKYKYTINDNDIINNNLDLRNLTEYETLKFPNKSIDTLIINKHFIENINKLSSLSASRIFIPFHNYMKFNKLKIVDDNDMKLVPINKIFNNANSNNTCFISNDDNKYIYIDDKKENNNILIYLDRNNNIKILEKKELLKDKQVEEVIIDFKISSSLRNRGTELILIKYKNYYIIKDFDNEYKIDSLFFIILSNIARKYFEEDYLINALKKYDLITIFNSVYFSKDLFYKMYNDYIEYKNYIEKLKELGFTNASIKYLFDKKIEFITYPKKSNLENISDIEIKCFNEIGDDYVKRKRLKYE